MKPPTRKGSTFISAAKALADITPWRASRVSTATTTSARAAAAGTRAARTSELENALDRQQAQLTIERSHMRVALSKLERMQSRRAHEVQ